MNILLINHYAGSPEMGMEFRPYYLAREWQKCNHQTLIVGASFSHLRKNQPETTGYQTINGVNYYWIKTNSYSGNGVKRVLSMLIFVVKLLLHYKKICKNFKPDAVIASSTYTFDNYACKRIAKHFSAKYIYEIHDLWPLSPMELGGMSPKHPFILALQHAENYAYRNVDAVVSILPKAEEHCLEHGLAKGKFFCVPNGIVEEDWQNPKPLCSEHKSLLDRLHADGKIVVGYVGGHAISNSLKVLLEACKLLKNENIAVVLVGNGQEKVNLVSYAKEQNLGNTYFLPPVSKQEIPSLLAEMDILYLGWQKHDLYRYGISPNKIFDYQRAAKPIVHAVEAGNNPVAEANCGISTQPDDINEIASAFIKLAKMSQQERTQLGKNGYNFVVKNHTYSILAQKFVEIINTI